jgi:tRNA A-37 threonylcarbamoyl transferase component Bud32
LERLERQLATIFLPPRVRDRHSAERARSFASMRTVWICAAIALDLTLYALLRRAPGIRPDVIELFGVVNVGLMFVDLGLTRLSFRRASRSNRALTTACILSETLAASVWIQMTGTVSSYFLIVGFLLIALYRLLWDYASGLTCALAMSFFHVAAFGLEAAGVLRPASIFVSAPLGIYETPLFRLAAMITLLTGYALTFVAMNFFASTLREKEVALKTAKRDLARAVDETRMHGRLCGAVLAGRYELYELLGRGGMGEVYDGRRIEDGLAVAVKVLHQHLVDRREMRERFRREADLLTRISDAHVAKVHECGVSADGEEFIVMDRLVGEDLATRLRRRGFLPLGELVPLVEKIAGALEAAHAAGVIHRDLKPENVFLLRHGNAADAVDAADQADAVRLLDFGIARFQDAEGLTLTLEVLGTPGYLTPEQVRGEVNDIGPHTDVFALGAIAYRAMTGKCAFPSRAPAAAVYEALNLTPPRPSMLKPALPEDVDDVIALALAKRWDQRYAHPALFARDLAQAAIGALGEEARLRARALAPVVTEIDAFRAGALATSSVITRVGMLGAPASATVAAGALASEPATNRDPTASDRTS